MLVQGEEEETQQKPVWLQEDGQEVGSPSADNASQLHLEGPTPTQPMDPQGAADFIGLDDDDTPGQSHNAMPPMHSNLGPLISSTDVFFDCELPCC